MPTVRQRHGQTDRRTDGRTTYDSNTALALRALRGKNMKISRFDPMRTRAGISTSAIHFIISKMVSAVRADATDVPTSRHKSSSTNGLAATGPQSGSNF